MNPNARPTPHVFRCLQCGVRVMRPGHLLLRAPICYACRAKLAARVAHPPRVEVKPIGFDPAVIAEIGFVADPAEPKS